MFFLYSSITLGIAYSFYKMIKYLFFPKLKSFDLDSFDEKEYMFLFYYIKYHDDLTVKIYEEFSKEEIKKLNDDKKIKYIIINYLYDNKHMKYITYSLDIEFPIYEIDIEENFTCEKVESVFLNDEDVTSYVKPFLGPKNNFYNDKNVKINLRDMFDEYPNLENLNFETGNIKLISFSGKELIYDLPWSPVWKQFSGTLDKTVEINYHVENNKSSSVYGFTVIDEKILE